MMVIIGNASINPKKETIFAIEVTTISNLLRLNNLYLFLLSFLNRISRTVKREKFRASKIKYVDKVSAFIYFIFE